MVGAGAVERLQGRGQITHLGAKTGLSPAHSA
jgi:hypothetical protein